MLHALGVSGPPFQAALVEHGDAHDHEHDGDRQIVGGCLLGT